jgi:hypothetical protein
MATSNDITPAGSIVPIYRVLIPTEIQADIDAHRQPPPEVKQALADNLKQSAMNKLIALGLTQDETEALYQPGTF